MQSPYIGVYEKLKRVDESVRNLDSEISDFFAKSDYPVLPQENYDALLKAIAYHKKLPIPPRFSVLAGEIVHHLRSSLDHLIWNLSGPEYRERHSTQIGFPVLEAAPSSKAELSGYERKIKGITNSRARKVIDDLQPYRSANPIDHPLLILHKMDVIDKHRALLIVAAVGQALLPAHAWFDHLQNDRLSRDLLDGLYPRIKKQGKVVPQVAFREFGRRQIQPVVEGLYRLAEAVRDSVGLLVPLWF